MVLLESPVAKMTLFPKTGYIVDSAGSDNEQSKGDDEFLDQAVTSFSNTSLCWIPTLRLTDEWTIGSLVPLPSAIFPSYSELDEFIVSPSDPTSGSDIKHFPDEGFCIDWFSEIKLLISPEEEFKLLNKVLFTYTYQAPETIRSPSPILNTPSEE